MADKEAAQLSKFETVMTYHHIRKEILKDFLQFPRFRVLSKSINESICRDIRKYYTGFNKLDIASYVHQQWDDNDVRREYYWVINGITLRLDELENFISFLINAVKVKVEEIHYENGVASAREGVKLTHDQIVRLVNASDSHPKEYYGMKLLCDGCSDCIDFPDKFEEHNFLTVNKFRHGFRSNTHFKRMSFSYEQITLLAKECVDCSNNKAECLELLSTFINSNISCETLNFEIHDCLSLGYPIEIIVQALKAWNVKKVEITIAEKRNFFCTDELWNHEPYFTSVSLGSQLPEDYRPEYLLNEVIFHLGTSSSITRNALQHADTKFITILRGMFVTNKISIFCPQSCPFSWGAENEMDGKIRFMTNVFNVISNNTLPDLELHISYHEQEVFCNDELPELLRNMETSGKHEDALKPLKDWNLDQENVLRFVNHNEGRNRSVYSESFVRKSFVFVNNKVKSSVRLDISIKPEVKE